MVWEGIGWVLVVLWWDEEEMLKFVMVMDRCGRL